MPSIVITLPDGSRATSRLKANVAPVQAVIFRRGQTWQVWDAYVVRGDAAEDARNVPNADEVRVVDLPQGG